MSDFHDPFETAVDPELDPAVQSTAVLVRRSLQEHRLRPQARDALRARLLAEAAGRVEAGTSESVRVPAARGETRSGTTRPDDPMTDPVNDPVHDPVHDPVNDPVHDPVHDPAVVRPLRPRRRRSAVSTRGWTLGAAAAVVAGLALTHSLPGPGDPVIPAPSRQLVNGTLESSTSTSQGISLSFSQPLDHASVEGALQLVPATTVTTSWQGNTLVVTPVHGFAANAAYALTIDHALARTRTGRPLAEDIQLRFVTAATADAEPAVGRPVTLGRTVLATADEGSQVVAAGDAGVLVSAARVPGKRPGLLRLSDGRAQTLAPAAAAICVSRSGRSIAYLSGEGSDGRIVFADISGTETASVPVQADAGTPLGWLGDEVAFVSGGRLTAVDRSGRVRPLLPDSPDTLVDAHRDTLVLAPGGRYAYLARAGGSGAVLDLTRPGRTFTPPGAVGAPAFTADGSGVVWVSRSGGTLTLQSAPASGGPVLSVRFPGLLPTDEVGDLAVSPDGALLVYSVRHANRSSELRLATLPGLATVATAPGGGGSPSWSPDGTRFTVTATRRDTPVVESVQVPATLAADDLTTARGEQRVAGVVRAFVNAQIAGDAAAAQALTNGVALPGTPPTSRADIVRIAVDGRRTATATVRLRTDPTDADPAGRQMLETLTLTLPAGGGAVPSITGVRLGEVVPIPPGPQVTRVDTTSEPGSVLVTLDGELDPGSVRDGVALLRRDGGNALLTATYDAPTRRLQLRATTSAADGPLTLELSTSLRDVTGTAQDQTFRLPGLVLTAG